MSAVEELLANLEKRMGGLDTMIKDIAKKSGDEKYPFEGDDDDEDEDDKKARKRVRLKKNGEFEDERDGQIAQLSKSVEDLVKALDESSQMLDEAAKLIDKMKTDHADELKKAKEGVPAATEDEIKKGEAVVVEGQTIRKSEVGEAQFAILKGQAEKIAKAAEDLAKEKELRETAELSKEADEKYPEVPGTTAERAAMLKAVAGMSDELKKSFTAVFEQSQKLAKTAFDTVGHRGGGELPETMKKAKADFDTKVAEIKKRDNCSNTEAMQKATREHPDLYKAYQGEPQAQ